MKNNRKIAVIIGLCLVLALSTAAAFASSPTDEIRVYTITADVNQDATVTLQYHIEWEVLESDGIGPVDWVTIGIPGSHIVSQQAVSSNIKSLAYDYSGGDRVRIDFTQKYYEGEIIVFDFTLVMDYMYEMNAVEDGYTLFFFTPGWFDEIDVDELTIRWNNEKLSGWSGDCLIIDGYNTWTTKLPMGSTFSVQLTYPNDAFDFIETKSFNNDKTDWDDDWNNNWDYEDDNDGGVIAGLIGLLTSGLFFFGIFKLFRRIYLSAANFGGAQEAQQKEVIKRTKITYHSKCPSCGAERKEGERNCPYCGQSFVKSEEVITEEHIKDADKGALKYNKNGEYAYSSDPNTTVRVNVVHVPIFTSGRSSGIGRSSGRSSGSTRSGGGRSSGGGCAHSSCACACASCACACACACASGGRAGCSAKDFYNTGLKLRQLERKKSKH